MKRLFLFLIVVLLIPINVLAISKDYVDKVSSIVNVEPEKDKINLYLFHGAECPHCEAEREWLKSIEKEYQEVLNVYYFEVWHDKNNGKLMEQVLEELEISKNGVPLTVVGDQYYLGYSNTVGSMIENAIKEYGEIKGDSKEVKIPIIGKVDLRKTSLPLVAIILGFIDGFNPCAMWILLFLINLLFGMKDKKKSWVLGLTFLFVSALVYFISMLGINMVLNIATIKWMKIAIAIFILGAGILSFKKYLKKRREEAGCDIVDNKKRKNIVKKMQKIMNSKSFVLALGGIVALAVSVNLIELACSLGFPLIFTEMLSLNSITGITKIVYMLLYIFFYMIDDMVVFTISMVTLEATGITNKYNKLCTLVSAIIMIIMGLLLLIKPSWLMLNF